MLVGRIKQMRKMESNKTTAVVSDFGHSICNRTHTVQENESGMSNCPLITANGSDRQQLP
jgi:hypothetical protein